MKQLIFEHWSLSERQWMDIWQGKSDQFLADLQVAYLSLMREATTQPDMHLVGKMLFAIAREIERRELEAGQ